MASKEQIILMADALGDVATILEGYEDDKALSALLQSARAFLEPYEDADCDCGRWRGNAAMNARQEIEELLSKVGA